MKKDSIRCLEDRKYAQSVFDAFCPNKPNDSCWIWLGTSNNPRGHIQACLHKRRLSAHRLAWLLYKGDIPEWGIIHHICRNQICVNPNHLALVNSQSDHVKLHAQEDTSWGRPRRLNNEAAKVIKYLFKKGNKTQTELGNAYHITQSMVSKIVNGVTYQEEII